jgi:hypothetical protein
VLLKFILSPTVTPLPVDALTITFPFELDVHLSVRHTT